jgi:hypothetical protein
MTRLLLAGVLLSGALTLGSTADAQGFAFTYTGNLENFTVPIDGTYQIVAFGAQGGNGIPPANGSPGPGLGGGGAEIGGDFVLKAGDVLQIAVGEKGENGISTTPQPPVGGGGGGGSFVVNQTDNNAPLAIAGGGGGGGASVSGGSPGGGGLTGTSGGDAPPVAGGTNGSGGMGGCHSPLGGAAGGGGFSGAGDGCTGGPTGGGAFPVLTGGSGVGQNGSGGFGGGGGAGGLGCGAGGGGYSGGAGAAELGLEGCAPGGGGGSFIDANATSQILVAGVWTHNGEVLINLVVPVFAGTPGKANCNRQSVSALAQQFGGLKRAAEALGYASVDALQNAILEFCQG